MTGEALPATRRPLDVGELLDRTVTLLVRRWALFLGILATVFVPLTVLQSFSRGGWGEMLGAISTASRTSGPSAGRQLGRMLAASHLGASDYGTLAMLVLVVPIAVGAVMYAASKAYDGETVSTGAALAYSARRWPAMLLFIAVWGLAYLVAFFMYVFASSLALAAVTAVFPRTAFSVPLLIGGALTFIVLGLAAGVVLYMTTSLAFAAIVLETANPFVAMIRSFERIWTKREFLRASLLSAALLFVSYTVAIFGLIAGWVVFWFTHVYALLVVLSQVGALGAYAFIYTLIAVYYRDLRLRREGGDLLDLADAAGAVTVS